MSRTGWFGLAAWLVAALGLGEAGCLITYDAEGVDLVQSSDTSPRIFVRSPQPNAVVGATLDVSVEPRNLTFVPHWGQANAEHEGHLFVTIDDTAIVSANAESGAADGEVASTAFQIDTSLLAASTHRLMIEVRNNDRTRFAGIQPVIVDFSKQ